MFATSMDTHNSIPLQRTRKSKSLFWKTGNPLCYVIVIAQRLCPQTRFVYCHKSLATRAITVICPLWLVSCHEKHVQKLTMTTSLSDGFIMARQKSSLSLRSFFVLACVTGPAVLRQRSSLKPSSTSPFTRVSHTHQLMSGSSLPMMTHSRNIEKD